MLDSTFDCEESTNVTIATVTMKTRSKKRPSMDHESTNEAMDSPSPLKKQLVAQRVTRSSAKADELTDKPWLALPPPPLYGVSCPGDESATTAPEDALFAATKILSTATSTSPKAKEKKRPSLTKLQKPEDVAAAVIKKSPKLSVPKRGEPIKIYFGPGKRHGGLGNRILQEMVIDRKVANQFVSEPHSRIPLAMYVIKELQAAYDVQFLLVRSKSKKAVTLTGKAVVEWVLCKMETFIFESVELQRTESDQYDGPIPKGLSKESEESFKALPEYQQAKVKQLIKLDQRDPAAVMSATHLIEKPPFPVCPPEHTANGFNCLPETTSSCFVAPHGFIANRHSLLGPPVSPTIAVSTLERNLSGMSLLDDDDMSVFNSVDDPLDIDPLPLRNTASSDNVSLSGWASGVMCASGLEDGQSHDIASSGETEPMPLPLTLNKAISSCSLNSQHLRHAIGSDELAVDRNIF